MNYYKMRAMLATDTGDFLSKFNTPEGQTYKDFFKSMVLKYGVTQKMVAEVLNTYGLQVEEGKLVKLNER